MKTLEDMAVEHYAYADENYSDIYKCSFCGRRYRSDDGFPIEYDGWVVCSRCRREAEDFFEEEESA